MAEHDEITRRAAEAVETADANRRRYLYDNHPSIEQVLAPFFAVARKEAREGALEEACERVCDGCAARYRLRTDALGMFHQRPASEDRIVCHAAPIHRALRSKPEEPA